MNRNTALSEPDQSEPRDLLSADDPALAFLAAHEQGRPVALATSGTSGAPRRVVRTTESWVSSFPHVRELAALDDTSRLWVPGPLSATMNLFAVVLARSLGLPVVDGPGRATHAQLTPTALARALDSGTVLDGRTVIVAGDRLTAALHARASAAGARVCHYYGAAELSFVGWGSHEGDLRPFPEVEIEVRDGEIWVRSPFVCQRYDGAPGPLRDSPDGFSTVGDRGASENGRLSVWGRGPDAVTTGGSTVRFAEVEHVLRPPARGEVVLVGLPHTALGAVVAAVLTDDGDLTRLREVSRSQLTPAQRPRVWFHLPTLPVTPAGKVDRRALTRLVADRDRDVPRLT